VIRTGPEPIDVRAHADALTAFHNLPASLAAARSGAVKALDADGRSFVLDFVPMRRDQERDIALLQMQPRDRQAFPHLSIGALEEGLSPQERTRFWAGRSVLVCGFPFNARGQEEDGIPGHVRGDAPFGIEDEKSGDGLAVQVERLRIVPDRTKDVGGISGGPVIDLESGFVVAVEGACHEGRKLILASELMRSAPTWPDDVRQALQRLENTPTDLHDQANALLEIPRQPWDAERLPPGALLRADCDGGVPFHARADERTDLEA